MEDLEDDTGDGSMLCTKHPFKNNTPAVGICAFCLQEKLGKLVSSSFPNTVFPSSSSSSTCLISDITTSNITTLTAMCSSIVPPSLLASSNTNNNSTSNEFHYQPHYSSNNRSRILYLLSQKKKKNKDLDKNLVFKRSKSYATPRHYMDSENGDDLNSQYKRGFWSFRYLQKPFTSSYSITKKPQRDISSNTLSTTSFPQRSRDTVAVKENDSPCQSSSDRKVSRSRSVGCGSRRFYGDFFDRISTGFGDCALRRVESHREGKAKVSGVRLGINEGQERVRCGGLFSGLIITSSSSSSSSSSSYWVSSSNHDYVSSNENIPDKLTSSVQHSGTKSWGWALASPMRAFSKPSSAKREQRDSNKPNLAAIPSILSVES
ncbi:uncharacterized protein [Rutidosis leptorrhynchoides]|uniref:uncharacterized protein n=1 Tax=Rutidosis leptorrhynchoides TaxID=125765 RepID=UPI003A999336